MSTKTMKTGGLKSAYERLLLVCFALSVLIGGCRPPPGESLRLSWERGRYPSRARPRIAPRQPGTAILVGVASDRRETNQRSGVRARILAIDGRKLTTNHPASEVGIAAGCHVIEASFQYKLTRADMPDKVQMLDSAHRENRVQVTDYSSGRKHFAIPIRAGKRYELSARIGTGVMSIHFAEVDPVLGTVAKHFPVEPETRQCVPGIPVGDPP